MLQRQWTWRGTVCISYDQLFANTEAAAWGVDVTQYRTVGHYFVFFVIQQGPNNGACSVSNCNFNVEIHTYMRVVYNCAVIVL